MRAGLNQVDIPSAVQFAKSCESSGASALFVHGRSQSQENVGPVNYEAIRAIKESVEIPVFGSGNILNPPLAKKMFDETRCDGILIAKGSFGNPSIYRDIETYLATGTWHPAIELREKLKFLKKHLLLVQQIKGPHAICHIGELAKICLWYLKGFSSSSRMRAQIFKSQNNQELLAQIESIMGDDLSGEISPCAEKI